MHKDTLKELYEPFELKARPGQGGKTFKYVPSNDIVDRMNKVFSGNWSTEVVEKEILDDQILIRVRVYVEDPMLVDSNRQYWQEGYASQSIARFTQGPKSGQIIDLGNSYKSAMSKAIKTAVARWGVGLYLEGESIQEEDAPGPWTPPVTPPESPTPPPKREQHLDTPFSHEKQPVSAPVAEPVNAPEPPSNTATGPDWPFSMPETGSSPAPTETPAAPPAFTDDNVVVTQPDTVNFFNPPVETGATTAPADCIST